MRALPGATSVRRVSVHDLSLPEPRLEPVTLTGARVELQPLEELQHRERLAAAIRDGELWTIKETVVPHPDDLGGFFFDADTASAAGRELAFATVDRATGAIAGSTRFRMFEPAHRRVEIGFTFLAGAYQRTFANTEAKLLMLRHAFDTLGLIRVEFLTDVRNAPSRAAIARLGAREEGVLRSHFILRDGYVRDSVLFSIVADEWPGVRERLEAALAG